MKALNLKVAYTFAYNVKCALTIDAPEEELLLITKHTVLLSFYSMTMTMKPDNRETGTDGNGLQ